MPLKDDFNAIYKILTALEAAMDCTNFDILDESRTRIGVSDVRLYRILEMLQDAGLIKNAKIKTDLTGDVFILNSEQIRITLKGLEYLQENSIMRKMYNAAKGIADLVP